MSTFCVRRSAGDSAAATGWSGQRRPIGPGVGTCPRPYRIVSVCRSAAAKHTRGSPTLCTRLERAGDQRAPLLTEPPLVHRHRRESPALLWAGRGHVPTPARSLSVHFVQRGSVSNGTLSDSGFAARQASRRYCVGRQSHNSNTRKTTRRRDHERGPPAHALRS